MFEILDEHQDHEEACLRRLIAAGSCTCGQEEDDPPLDPVFLGLFATVLVVIVGLAVYFQFIV